VQRRLLRTALTNANSEPSAQQLNKGCLSEASIHLRLRAPLRATTHRSPRRATAAFPEFR